MNKYIFCMLLMSFGLSISGCKDVMEEMNERQYIENGVWDLTLWDQSLWGDNIESGENKN
ncbi:MAG: hypothetical protein FWG49_00110 [Leptospirales bacterium]|nr:hypothetical protein [Leptospirales bacterium]